MAVVSNRDMVKLYAKKEKLDFKKIKFHAKLGIYEIFTKFNKSILISIQELKDYFQI